MNYSKIRQLEYKWRKNSALGRYVLLFWNIHLHINPISTGQNQSGLWHFDHKDTPLEQRFLKGECASGDHNTCTDALLLWCPRHPPVKQSQLFMHCISKLRFSQRLQCSSFSGFHCMQPDHLWDCMGNTGSHIQPAEIVAHLTCTTLLSAFPWAHHLVSHLQKLTAA